MSAAHNLVNPLRARSGALALALALAQGRARGSQPLVPAAEKQLKMDLSGVSERRDLAH